MLGTKEIAAILEVQPVTVRKYAQALESAGYIFERSDGKNREYNDTDVTAFKDLVSICKRSGMSIEKVAELIAAKHIKALQVSESVSVVPIKEENERYDELINVVKQLTLQNKEILEQNERLHNRMAEQNANLTQIMKEIHETKQMIAAEKERKNWKFWKRKKDENDPETFWKKREKRIY